MQSNRLAKKQASTPGLRDASKTTRCADGGNCPGDVLYHWGDSTRVVTDLPEGYGNEISEVAYAEASQGAIWYHPNGAAPYACPGYYELDLFGWVSHPGVPGSLTRDKQLAIKLLDAAYDVEAEHDTLAAADTSRLDLDVLSGSGGSDMVLSLPSYSRPLGKLLRLDTGEEGVELTVPYAVVDTGGVAFVAVAEDLMPEGEPWVVVNAWEAGDVYRRGQVRLVIGEMPEIEILDAARAKTEYVEIARWDNAYTPGPDYDVKNSAEVNNNFIDLDAERFYVRVTDHSRNTDPGEKEVILTQIGSVGVDDLTDVKLEETDANTGIFESKRQLLTTIDFDIPGEGQASGGIAGHLRYTDDNFRAHDGASAVIEDDGPNDRTHQAQVGGAVTVAYEATSGRTFEQAVSVCHPDSVKQLDVEIIVFNEPYLDEGYDHDGDESTPPIGANNGEFDFLGKAPGVKHQPGVPSEPYRDLSVYEPEYGKFGGIWRLIDIPEPLAGNDPLSKTGDGHGGVVSEERVQAELLRAQSAWAQACIVVERVNVAEPVDVPASIKLRMLKLGKFSEGYAVVEAYKDDMRLDVFYVFFTPPMDYTLFGEAYLPSESGGRDGDVSYAFIASGPVRMSDNRILAHEIGHALSNRNDEENERYFFFPQTPRPFPDTDVVTERRLARDTLDQCRMRRPPGAYDQAGNLLLKSS